MHASTLKRPALIAAGGLLPAIWFISAKGLMMLLPSLWVLAGLFVAFVGLYYLFGKGYEAAADTADRDVLFRYNLWTTGVAVISLVVLGLAALMLGVDLSFS